MWSMRFPEDSLSDFPDSLRCFQRSRVGPKVGWSVDSGEKRGPLSRYKCNQLISILYARFAPCAPSETPERTRIEKIEEISLTLQGVEDEVGAGRAREDQEGWSFGVNRVWSSRSGSARRSSRELEKSRPLCRKSLRWV